MKTVKKLLKKTKSQPDNTKVTLTLNVPLKKVRANAKRFASLGVVNVTIVGGAKAAAKKAKPKASAKKVAKKAVTRKKPAVKRNVKAVAKKTVRAKAPTKRATTGVTQAAVLAALRGKHSTPIAIATAMKANRVQVTKALSRYTQQGLIVRTQPGHYALKK